MSLRVSVIIPVFKAAAWVEATLESLAQQTFPLENIEVIVVDDASPDDSLAIAQRFLERHGLKHHTKVLEKNGGVSITRNAGLKMASGDWVNFLDADDLLAPHKLALQMERAASAAEDVAVVYSNWQSLVLLDGKWQPSGPLNAPFIDDDPILRILQELNFGYVGPTLIRRSFVERVGGFPDEPNLGEDCDLMLRMAMAGGRFREARSETAAFLYRQAPNSLWRVSIKSKRAMHNLLHGFRSVELFLRKQTPDGSLSEPLQLALAKRYSRFADLYFEHDPENFRLLMGWLKALGQRYPTNLTPRLKTLSRVIGYERALQLRSAFRKHVRPRLGS